MAKQNKGVTPADRLYCVLDLLALEVPAEVLSHARGEIMAAFDSAVKNEREACARIADEAWGAKSSEVVTGVVSRIAKQIRARNPEDV